MSVDVTIPVDDVTVKVYDVKCDCGEDLTFNVTLDNDGDFRIAVDEHVCIQEEDEE